MWIATLAALLAPLSATRALEAHPRQQDPVITIDKCREPVVPLGHVRGSGILRTVLSPDGRPDTAHLEVGAVEGLSAPGMRSVAARQLAACRFRIQPKPKAALQVLQQFVIDSSGLSIRTIPAYNRPFTPMDLAVPPLPDEVFAEDDPRLEEGLGNSLATSAPDGAPSLVS